MSKNQFSGQPAHLWVVTDDKEVLTTPGDAWRAEGVPAVLPGAVDPVCDSGDTVQQPAPIQEQPQTHEEGGDLSNHELELVTIPDQNRSHGSLPARSGNAPTQPSRWTKFRHRKTLGKVAPTGSPAKSLTRPQVVAGDEEGATSSGDAWRAGGATAVLPGAVDPMCYSGHMVQQPAAIQEKPQTHEGSDLSDHELELVTIPDHSRSHGSLPQVAPVPEGSRTNPQLAFEAVREGEVGVTEVEQRTFVRIVDTLHLSIEPIPAGEEVPPVKATRGESCVDLICQTCVCQSPFRQQTQGAVASSPALPASFGGQAEQSGTPNEAGRAGDEGRGVIRKAVQARNIMTPILQRGRAIGWAILQGITLPFVTDVVRDAWIIAEVITVLVALAFSLSSFSLGNKEVFNAIHLGLTILSTILAVTDAVVNLWQFRSCKRCKASCGRCGDETRSQNESRRSEAPDLQQSNETVRCCHKCLHVSKSVSDFIRMLLTELILYPLLICDIFDLATEEGYKPGTSATDIIGFILFLISSFSLLFYVYILRLVILAYMIKTVQKTRKQVILCHGGQYQFASSSDTAFRYQIHFFIHVFTQMVVQILMLIAIGAKIEYENRGDHDSIRVSNHLWYMLIAGYVLPICGLLTFFMITYYWTQEFPVGVCVDLISILEMPGSDHALFPGESAEDCVGKLVEIAESVHEAELKQEFERMHHDTAWYRKFLHPAHSPVIIILCIVYTAFQLAFIICATYAIDPETNEMTRVVLSDGLGWTVYYGIAVGVCILVNLYVFVIAGFWTFVVALVIALVILYILTIILAIIQPRCCCCCDDDD